METSLQVAQKSPPAEEFFYMMSRSAKFPQLVNISSMHVHSPSLGTISGPLQNYDRTLQYIWRWTWGSVNMGFGNTLGKWKHKVCNDSNEWLIPFFMFPIDLWEGQNQEREYLRKRGVGYHFPTPDMTILIKRKQFSSTETQILIINWRMIWDIYKVVAKSASFNEPKFPDGM